jgi:hypothetical protein
MSEIEEVDAAALAELDRIAREHDVRPAEPLVIPRRMVSREELEKQYPAAPPAPPPPLRPFVDVATVEAHLQALDARYEALEKQSRHIMLLVMLLGDRFHITPEEYRRAELKVAAIEQGDRA